MREFQVFPKRFGVLPYVFLIYLALPLIYVLQEKGVKAVIGYLLILLFLVSYRQLYFLIPMKKISYWLVIQFIIIFIMSIWYNPNTLFMGFFPANFVGWFSNKKQFRWALATFTGMLALSIIMIAWKHQLSNIYYFFPFLLVMLASPFGIRSMNTKMELEKKLDQANQQIKELIKREERIRIARDLHDTLGHTLSLITLQSQLVQRLTSKDPERAKQEAKEIESTSRSALRQVRELVSEMRSITIAEEIADMEQIFTTAGIAFHVEKNQDFSHIPLLQQNIIGMCLKEAATNIVKHSQAKNCTLSIIEKEGFLSIAVKDDGIGLLGQHQSGNGLKGMNERLALIDGTLNISSNKGTELMITVPIIVKQAEVKDKNDTNSNC
ncbi:histidine kinase [Lederbergia wuyishanensis]|uniref:histidine kinase n=1 Tax=Lederbergia wuyishanensis TaxID=1347903 RepID=A0ABU0D614_9BACI|nr:sensor histidine kinase [Lederbergia wuyishanensis]MCJ8008413.1 sensor histidine kinase [Lederbergia wuyishanensis]MDQ0343830.1 two-component system sensor histidine kinase DesK [Lederbergia wuyishanensis]